MKTHYIKKHKFKDITYKFKEPLKIITDTFLCADLKTVKSELYIPIIPDGFSGDEFKNPEKEIKTYLTYVFNEYLTKKDEELNNAENLYKKKWLSLLAI